ncbi:ATPMutT/nudix family protein [Streptococcus pseudoporcinus]|uniref:ATPMutT/nudix family protein n=1 Tax=Streptococcus pseudoporcinus TaxID=361101 RepID=A0A4U9YZA9_9STRE|nr:NUDIX hydrolase [Streptococcus pseudoporcinus]VTS32372.1 ATPMutT/nudix family protein [Streptococcus pseudoporcinus]
MTVPVFGEKSNHKDYQTRYGAYAIIPNQEAEKIILVQAPNGSWFLPGGEIENGENHDTALKRELLEELGFSAEIGYYYGQADEYFYSRHRDTYYYNPAFLYEVIAYHRVGNPLEDFNNLAWFPVEEAIGLLKRGSHKWGVLEWQKHHH